MDVGHELRGLFAYNRNIILLQKNFNMLTVLGVLTNLIISSLFSLKGLADLEDRYI